ncbi:MAG TPA: hypothetical protein VL134_08795 [Leptolyngbya sp.]|nr:hypothetical protein [Leptolyngbya sp.]
MSRSIQPIVKLGAMLPLLLGVTIFHPAKASALDVSQIPLFGSALQRGLSLEPSLKLFDQGINRNNLQVCVLSCAPMPNVAAPTPIPPQMNRSLTGAGGGTGELLPQPVMQLPGQVMQLPGQVLQQGMQLPGQMSQPNVLMQQSQPSPGMPIPQPLPPVPQSNQIQPKQTTLQQVGQVLLPQLVQAIGR